MTDRKINAVDPKKVEKGDVMSFTYYVKVKEKSPNSDRLLVEDLDGGKDIAIQGEELIKTAHSANFFTEEEKVSKTQAAEMLVSSHNRPFSVCFEKADGTERVLVGRLVKPEPLLGRSMCEDLETKDSHRLRLVDHRTIKWLIVDGVKYSVK